MADVARELDDLPPLRPGVPLEWLAAEPWRAEAAPAGGAGPAGAPAPPPSWPETAAARCERAALGASASTSPTAPPGRAAPEQRGVEVPPRGARREGVCWLAPIACTARLCNA